MTDPHVRSTIPNSYVDQKDGFSTTTKKVCYFPSGWKRKSGGEKKMVHQDRRKPGGIKRLQNNLEKREKVENDQERRKKVEEARCTGGETSRGCCRGFSEEVVHGGGSRGRSGKDG